MKLLMSEIRKRKEVKSLEVFDSGREVQVKDSIFFATRVEVGDDQFTIFGLKRCFRLV